MPRRRLGVSVMPLDNRREALVATAVAADRLGYDGFFLPETWALDITVLLAEAAVKTSGIVDLPMLFLRPNLPREEMEYTLDAFRPMLESSHG